MQLSNAQYARFVEKRAPRSKVGVNALKAFAVGGAICAFGEIVRNFWLVGFEADDAGLLTSVTLIALGAILTGLGVYDRLAKHAGAGTLVPITGFANSVVAPALEYRPEGMITGTAVKMFSIAGPVIVYGILAGTVYGVILWVLSR